MEKCPICRARWRDQTVTCRRCGADLNHAIRLLKLGKQLERRAVNHMLRGEIKLARKCIQRANLHHASEFSKMLVSFL